MPDKETPINPWFYYREYLRDWADSHADMSYQGMSPANYPEWYANEYQELLAEV